MLGLLATERGQRHQSAAGTVMLADLDLCQYFVQHCCQTSILDDAWTRTLGTCFGQSFKDSSARSTFAQRQLATEFSTQRRSNRPFPGIWHGSLLTAQQFAADGSLHPRPACAQMKESLQLPMFSRRPRSSDDHEAGTRRRTPKRVATSRAGIAFCIQWLLDPFRDCGASVPRSWR